MAQTENPPRSSEHEPHHPQGSAHPDQRWNEREQARQEEPRDQQDNKDAKPGNREDAHGDKPKGPPIYKRPAVIIPVAAVLLLGIAAGVVYWLHARHFESTDDAYIDGHVAQISPEVAAQVIALHIQDNQFVHQGDLLVELDPTNYQVALAQARAEASSAEGKLDQARAQIGAAQAGVTQATAEVEAAQVALENATRELERLQAVDERARSRQQLDNAFAAQRTGQAQLEQAKAKGNSAQAKVVTAQASVKAAEGDLEMAQSAVRRAEVNLSYCRIVSPCDGRVTQRTVEAGNYVQIGQALFMLVEPEVWVTANFKETQLKHMRVNQPVTIRVDAVPGRKFSAHVDSIQAGSGSRFSVLPAENATGNFVKVVQRVPVKIVFDHLRNEGAWGLAPGLSVIPKVRVQ
ncbi:MAG TPA: HlyD family secretion protein [Verrucomicrobiae bacterium]|nr:HlyD family secretion protein [Verrucomicrobiae bacterium]